MPDNERRKIALFTNVDERAIISAVDVDNLFKIPRLFHEQGLDDIVVNKFGITTRDTDLSEWDAVVHAMEHPIGAVNVAMVGKYTGLTDSYKSLSEALIHAGIHTRTDIEIHYVDSEDIERDGFAGLEGMDAILVPGGFGDRGIEGKIAAANYARENHVPYLGICLGMQVAVIGFARYVAGLHGADSTEFVPATPHPVIALITEWLNADGVTEIRDENSDLGGTMRLGGQECQLLADTLVRGLYGSDIILERHRHRYEFNNNYRTRLEQHGLKIAGISLDEKLVEIVELSNHPWFVGCQFHPEFNSHAKGRTPAVYRVHQCRPVPPGRAATESQKCGYVTLTRGHDLPLFLIAGPCVIESEQLALDTAGSLREITGKLSVPFVYKSSFDKANRSSGDSYRGPGLERGLQILEKVKDELGVPVLTDVHEDTPLDEVAAVADVLQTPAFLCRQTNFIRNVAACGLPVNIKKGQFLAPWDMVQVVEKARATGNERLLVCERGASFGYNNLISDMRALVILRETGCPVVFDATHSVQLPGARGSQSGGQREFVPALSRAAVAVGVAGVFMETHPDPETALSDGANSVPLHEMPAILESLVDLDRCVKTKPA